MSGPAQTDPESHRYEMPYGEWIHNQVRDIEWAVDEYRIAGIPDTVVSWLHLLCECKRGGRQIPAAWYDPRLDAVVGQMKRQKGR